MGAYLQRLLVVLRLLPPFIGRELYEQYAGSMLGVAWSILQPALYVLLYWWIFAVVMRTRFPAESALADTPFIVFLLSALLPWFAFQEGLNRAAGAIIGRRDMVCKVHFPVAVFPLSVATAAFLVHVSSYILFLVVLVIWRGNLSFDMLGAVMILLCFQYIVTAGVSLLLASLTVYLRDMAQILGLLLAVMFYTAPVLYPLTMAPEEFHVLIWCNPFTLFAEGYHLAVLAETWPSCALLTTLALFSTGVLTAGVYVFRRLESGFADVL